MNYVLLDKNSSGVLEVNEGTYIHVSGYANIEQIVINTEEKVTISGDCLEVHCPRSEPAIGILPYHVSFGRWQHSRIELNLSIELKKLVTTSQIDRFSVGSFGTLPDLKSILKGDGDYSGVSGLDAVFCYCPGARDDSTKISGDPVYLDNDGYQVYLQEQIKKKCFSTYPKDEKMYSMLVDYGNDCLSINDLIAKVTTLEDVGKLIGNLSLIMNDCNQVSKYIDMLEELSLKEKQLWGPSYPKYTLSMRAMICCKDRQVSSITHGEYGYFMNQLNLDERLHKVYFPNEPMREYTECQSYMWGQPLFDTVTNEFVDASFSDNDVQQLSLF